MSESSLSIVFEFARTETPDDPYAFRFRPQTYTLRTKHGGRKSVHLDWSDTLLQDLDALRHPQCDPGAVQRIGRVLCNFLEPAGWSWHAQAIAQTAQQSRRVYLTIRSAAAELYALPWELLSLEGSGQCVGELPTVLLRYEWPETHTVPRPTASEPVRGRVLVGWSAAGGSVPERKHVEAISLACRASGYEFDNHRDVIANASVATLADALERSAHNGQPISVLHLLCHGTQAGQTNGVMLDDESGGQVAVDALRLRQIVAPHAATLRLVVLMVCDSANGGAFDSIAQSLHRAGVQAVVGARFMLSVRGSCAVADMLYQSLMVRRHSLEDAFLLARKQLAREASYLDWASLQLYARPADGDASHPIAAPAAGKSAADAGAHSIDVLSQIAFGLLDLATLVKLRDLATYEIESRFTQELTLACVKIVDTDGELVSDPALRKRCRELLAAEAVPLGGQFFDAASDRLCLSYPNTRIAIKSIASFSEAVTKHNYHEIREHQLIVHVGLHHGSVLSDGRLVTGPAVNVAMRIAAASKGRRVLLSEAALRAAPQLVQAQCSAVNAVALETDEAPLQLYAYRWRDNALIPTAVLIKETNEEIPLPAQDLVSFGRLDRLPDGSAANDIVLTHPNGKVQRAISRWHFEFRRTKDGYVLRSISRLGTAVNGINVDKDEEVPVAVGSVLCVAQKLELVLLGHQDSRAPRHAATVTISL